jgi:hypothetical protein
MAGIFHNPAPGLNFLALIRGRGPPAKGRINVAAAARRSHGLSEFSRRALQRPATNFGNLIRAPAFNACEHSIPQE